MKRYEYGDEDVLIPSTSIRAAEEEHRILQLQEDFEYSNENVHFLFPQICLVMREGFGPKNIWSSTEKIGDTGSYNHGEINSMYYIIMVGLRNVGVNVNSDKVAGLNYCCSRC